MTGSYPSSQEESLPISLIAHTLFCHRRAWLEAMGEKSPQSWAMRVGDSDHRRTHETTTGTSRRLRGIDVADLENGFHGRIDTADILPSGGLRLTEYKATPVRREAVVSEASRVQLALQTMALEFQGYKVEEHSVFFTTHHQQVPVILDDRDREMALSAVETTRTIVGATVAPRPLIDDRRCYSCSHVSLCLPDERAEERVTRQIKVSDPAGQVLHLSTYGARASLKSGRIIVQYQGEELASLPIEQVNSVVVHGNVDLSSALQRELLWRAIPLVWCSSSGRVVGWARSAHSPNGLARVEQHLASAEGRLGLAREFIVAKISNQATFLRRYAKVNTDVKQLRLLQSQVAEALTIGQIFGIEGIAAGVYFNNFEEFLNAKVRGQVGDFPGRVGRGASDPVNICLNYTYALLQSEVLRAVVACGLDPHAGFLHSANRNKPALVLDLMEEFRAPIADSVVVGALNNGEVAVGRFQTAGSSLRIDDRSRKSLIAAFERRVETEFTHPVFGYKVSWRRAMEIQARMVLGYLDGSQNRYVGIRVR
ncbi:CRISPR-associated endonuclease Cas1 [Flaviflexus equikiangi]|uniref:CRISPR-associated endonuclease Cas1 n=1 Tax=Flaviflexus equikiangi TaxID=2758573 RepID=A0ABS2THU5_9ACTO|nr:CRISPR-associated endonuclease Cas1 [Flaviflexus equikiangi]MBM9433923.1 CRISPR-associated endonuclease Cas1 [Flaviflexus equikiangi]